MTAILVNYWNLQELKRHNLAYEQETVRHNVSTENIQSAQVSLGYAQLGEDMRHNKVMEQRVTYQNIADLSRSTSQIVPMFLREKKDSGNPNSKGSGGRKEVGGAYVGKYLKDNVAPVVGQKTPSPDIGVSSLDPSPYQKSGSWNLIDIISNAITMPFAPGALVPIIF